MPAPETPAMPCHDPAVQELVRLLRALFDACPSAARPISVADASTFRTLFFDDALVAALRGLGFTAEVVERKRNRTVCHELAVGIADAPGEPTDAR